MKTHYNKYGSGSFSGTRDNSQDIKVISVERHVTVDGVEHKSDISAKVHLLNKKISTLYKKKQNLTDKLCELVAALSSKDKNRNEPYKSPAHFMYDMTGIAFFHMMIDHRTILFDSFYEIIQIQDEIQKLNRDRDKLLQQNINDNDDVEDEDEDDDDSGVV